ncbi:MAG: glutathione ABC transporter substrate-binding protein [Firmicutes bacterium]|nr:glutathione ABC transporter substrate-binding protein [Bacillota bacterium]
MQKRDLLNVCRSLLVMFAVVSLIAIAPGAAAENGRVVYAIDVDITNLDPVNSIDPGSAAVNQQIYEPLVRMGSTGDIEPVLAESWSVASDKITWSFNLKKGVKFQDGTPFDAAAVKTHFDRLLDPDKPSRARGAFTMIKKVETAGSHTVKFVLAKPYAPFLAVMTDLGGLICSPTAVEKWGDDYPFHPVGTGPWMFKEWLPADHTTLVPNPNYWGGKPKISELVFKPVPEPSARVIMLENGQADVANTIMPDEMKRLERSKDITVQRVPVLRGWFIGLNVLEKPFDDVRVRKALNHAVDVNIIANQILRGTARPLTAPVNSRVWGYSRQTEYEYDPVKAKKLLAEAGYAKGFEANLWVPASGAGFMPEVPQAIQAMLAEVGVKVKIIPFEMSAFIDNIIKDPVESKKSGKHMVMMGIGARTGEAATIMDEFFGTGSWAPVKYNRCFYSNEAVDKLLEQALQTFDQAKQKAILAKAQEMVWDEAPWIFLYEMMGVYGYRDNVKGLQWLASNYILFHTVEK